MDVEFTEAELRVCDQAQQGAAVANQQARRVFLVGLANLLTIPQHKLDRRAAQRCEHPSQQQALGCQRKRTIGFSGGDHGAGWLPTHGASRDWGAAGRSDSVITRRPSKLLQASTSSMATRRPSAAIAWCGCQRASPV